MPASLSTVSALTKEIYEPKLRLQLNDDSVLFSKIEKSSENVKNETGGRYVTYPIHVSRNSGIGARRENETLPVSGNQGTVAARVGLKYLYGAVGLSGPVMDLVESDFQTFINSVDFEMSRLKIDLKKDQNRMVYGNGTGAIGTTSSSTTITTPVITSGINYFQIGELVDVLTAANLAADGATKATALTVLAVEPVGLTITLSAAVAFTNGDVFVRTGSQNREWTGLGAIVNNSGILYNIDPAVYPVWAARVDDPGAARALSEGLIIKNVDAVRTAGAKTDLLVTSLGVRRSYFQLLQQQRMYMNTKDFAGGFTGLTFTTDAGEIGLLADIDSPYNTLYGLSLDNIKLYREKDWSFMDRDGGMWYRSATKDAYSATMYQYSELGTDRRNAHFVMRNLIES